MKHFINTIGHSSAMTVSQEDRFKGVLLLVNQACKVQKEPEPSELVSAAEYPGLHIWSGESLLLQRECMDALAALLLAADSDAGITLVSGYRSIEEQQSLYEQSLRERGEAYTKGYVAFPGSSEHQTGLAIDVGLREQALDYITPAFPDDGASGDFKRLASRYGFIQRYEQGKEAITTINSEPWHYRYVGYPHAELMRSSNLCLEEYIALVRNYPHGSEPLFYKDGERTAAIYFVKAEGEGATQLPIVDCDFFNWSGNNDDGFIVTAFGPGEWRNGFAQR